MDKIEKEKLFDLRVEFNKETGFSCNVNDGEFTDWLEKKAIKNLGDIGDVITRLYDKNTVFNEAVSFANCNDKRDFEDTKATFIGGVNWLKNYLEVNE